MKTDSLFYRLMQAQPTLAFELAGYDVPEPARYGFVSQEIKQTAFRLDGIAEPPADRSDAPRGYMEVQFQPDETFYLRFFSEILLHLRQYPSFNPWRAVVLYPSAAVERCHPSMESLLTLPNVHRVYLDELPLLDSLNPRLWLVALILEEVENLAPIVDKIKDFGRNRPADDIDWLELLETVLVYKLPNFTREEILNMFNFADISIQETRYYQDAIEKGLARGIAQGVAQGVAQGMAQGVAQGMAQGMAQGVAQGIAQGKQEGEAAVLLRLLERKFRSVPDSARQRIAEADAETLLVWAERVLDADSLDQVWERRDLPKTAS